MPVVNAELEVQPAPVELAVPLAVQQSVHLHQQDAEAFPELRELLRDEAVALDDVDVFTYLEEDHCEADGCQSPHRLR